MCQLNNDLNFFMIEDIRMISGLVPTKVVTFVFI